MLARWRGAETSMLCLFQELLYLAGAQEAEEGLRLVGHPHLWASCCRQTPAEALLPCRLSSLHCTGEGRWGCITVPMHLTNGTLNPTLRRLCLVSLSSHSCLFLI